uniref:Hypotheticial protein n=1 Tax=Schistosoma japonicum TaxID=6182 RepID=C1L689_SCHJA|nr:hypotheticial protein [Schistosoma japonicum]
MSKIITFFTLILLLSCSSYLINIVVDAGSNGLSTMQGHKQGDFWSKHGGKDPSNKNLSDPYSYGRR